MNGFEDFEVTSDFDDFFRENDGNQCPSNAEDEGLKLKIIKIKI